MLELLERLRAASLAQDPERLAGLYSPDGVHEFPFVTPTAPTHIEGRAAILEFNATVFRNLPFAYSEYRTVATHQAGETVLVVEQEAKTRRFRCSRAHLHSISGRASYVGQPTRCFTAVTMPGAWDGGHRTDGRYEVALNASRRLAADSCPSRRRREHPDATLAHVAVTFPGVVDTATAQKARGAFYTPPALARYVIESAVHSADDDVLKPSCGDGAFLLAAGQRLDALAAGTRGEHFTPTTTPPREPEATSTVWSCTKPAQVRSGCGWPRPATGRGPGSRRPRISSDHAPDGSYDAMLAATPIRFHVPVRERRELAISNDEDTRG